MSRPKAHGDRVTTAIRFPVDLHTALTATAAERDVPLNTLVVRACGDYLARLIPLDEVLATRVISPADGQS